MKKGWIVGMSVLCLGLSGAVNAEEAPAKSALADNLQAVRKVELTAKADYEAFAAKADVEGVKSAAALFRAAAKSMGITIAKHEAALKDLKVAIAAFDPPVPDVKSSKENLEKMVADKTALIEKSRPASIKAAEAEKNGKAAMSFKGAVAADAEYVKLAKEAAANLDAWKAGDKEFFVCEVCTFVMTDPKIEKCPICTAPRAKFVSFK